MSALFDVQELTQVFKELESLILAQNERWRQVLGMQVKRAYQSIFCVAKNRLGN